MTGNNEPIDVIAPSLTREQLTNLSPADKMLRASMGLDQEHRQVAKTKVKSKKVKSSKV